jgi:hypothetical protein
LRFPIRTVNQKVTGGEFAAAMQRNAISAMVNVAIATTTIFQRRGPRVM